ncbi:hypothetical protein ACOALZ_00500 [Nocardiopsis algeriensis]|uniref:hypothetical protein n=1 Tax=Nocardiopsis algeriensis TaxID=1478215 RepID=UPI003B43A231
MVEVGGAGEVGPQAGDTEDDLLAGPFAVKLAGVTTEAEDLGRAGEQGAIGGCGAQGAAFNAAVPTVVVDRGGLDEVGVRAGQQRLNGGVREGPVALDDQDAVAAQRAGDQAGGLLRGV